MPSLAETQREFAAALLDPNRPIPPGLVGPNGQSSSRRFNVYRNNVVVGLVSSLKDAFPVVLRLVGEPFFQVMARIYVAQDPPVNPMMFDYGANFPAFIEAFDPADCLPYLSDVARIERGWSEAYHAAEGCPIEPASLIRFSQREQPHICFTLHPSLRLIRSRFPALTIWRMNVDGGVPRSVDLDQGGEDILILRPQAEVETRLLLAGSAEFLLALDHGFSVGEATAHALATTNAFDLSVNLAGLLAAGAFVDSDRRSAWEIDQP